VVKKKTHTRFWEPGRRLFDFWVTNKPATKKIIIYMKRSFASTLVCKGSQEILLLQKRRKFFFKKKNPRVCAKGGTTTGTNNGSQDFFCYQSGHKLFYAKIWELIAKLYNSGAIPSPVLVLCSHPPPCWINPPPIQIIIIIIIIIICPTLCWWGSGKFIWGDFF